MKLIIIPELEELILEVTTTGKEKKELFLPKTHIHYWYPFNINFSYKYTDSKGFMYLVKEKNYEGENVYNVDILKRTKVLPLRNGTPFNEAVFNRNMYIMDKASATGIKTLLDDFTLEDVKKGFKKAGEILSLIKAQVERRNLAETGEHQFFFQTMPTEDWDELIYSKATEKESQVILEIGEIYTMLSVMRKLVEEG
jgi:hypothetical protein